VKARRVFAKRELGVSDLADEYLEHDNETAIGEAIAEKAEEIFGEEG